VLLVTFRGWLVTAAGRSPVLVLAQEGDTPMIIFVTGGTGALGTPTVALLRDRGYQVRALASSAGSARKLADAGAEPVRASLFDPESLAAAVRGADAILHLATRIAPQSKAWRRSAWLENDRIRAEGTHNLVDAALATGVGPSFAPIYADGGDQWLSAGSPIAPTDILRSTVTAEEEVSRFGTHGGRGVVLRTAGIYGPHSASTRDVLALAFSAFMGPAGGYQVGGLGRGRGDRAARGGGDRRPLRRVRHRRRSAAEQSRARRRAGRRGRAADGTPGADAVARLLLGKRISFLLRSQRVFNQRFRDAAGWAPEVKEATDGVHRLRALAFS
jgi:uncharacterized protein YbjT (DUF2867 family)